jgi:hypothetical protein
MKFALLACFAVLCLPANASTPDVSIPDHYISLIKTTDLVEVTGTNDLGGAENFSIHNAKAISQFLQLLTSDRYTAVPKNLKPEFKSMSSYKVSLTSNGTPVLEFQVIADSVLDIPGETSYYMESDRHSDNLMAPLLRLR